MQNLTRLSSFDSFNGILCHRNMPQDNLRSAVYRSFVTCDDPTGVIECRTIRKSKTSSKKSDKIERNHHSHKEGEEEMGL